MILIGGLYLIMRPFLSALAWAVILAVFFSPAHKRIESLIKKPALAALCSLSLVTLLLILPVLWIVPKVVAQTIQVVKFLPNTDILQRLNDLLQQNAHRLPVPPEQIQDSLADWTQQALGIAARQSAAIAGGVAHSLFEIFVALFAMFYLFRDGPRILRLLRDVSPIDEERFNLAVRIVRDVVQVSVSSSLIVSGVQGLLGGLLFWALSMPAPAFWGVVTAFLSLLPLVGPPLIWGSAGVYLVMNGEVTRGIIMLAVGAGVVSTADNILRPVLIAGRAELNGLLVFFSLLGGVGAFGFLGLVLGPLLVYASLEALKFYRAELAVAIAAPPPGSATGALRESNPTDH